MLYKTYLKNLKGCPFCKLEKEEILRSNKYANLIVARAPYTKNHLLIVPKRHIFSMTELKGEEKKYVEKLLFYSLKKLHKKYKNVSVLFREGNKKEVGKSINHLHIHLIPNLRIGPYDISLNKRRAFDEEEYCKITEELKRFFR